MKTKNEVSLFIFPIILLSIFISTSCIYVSSNRDLVEKKTELTPFNKIKLIGGYDVKLAQSDTFNVKLIATELTHKSVKIWVEDSILFVQNKIKNVNDSEVKLTIFFPTLASLEIQGGVNLKTVGFLKLNDFNIKVEGGANIDMKIYANKIRSKAQGGVNIVFEGTAERFESITEGAGNIDADNLESKNVVCRMSGVGNSSVYATDSLFVTLEGIGKVGYRGNPHVTKKVEGLGMVYRN